MRAATKGKPPVRSTCFPEGTRVVCTYGKRAARVGTSRGVYIYSDDARVSVLWDGDEAADIVLESVLALHEAGDEQA
jgi:hypothetical protein